ncbi:MAG: Flavodoxin reductase (ferredoxin-NADPH reductase) family 1 [Actinomycetia bacterium]|nr:Flavodoxin reductase (ferredoxin-NADPH reductase) family 1 [Actinomycetes bacterium]
MSSNLLWYTARAGGIVAWTLVSASVVWGLLMSTKVTGKKVRPNWMLDLHRGLGALAVIFTVVHVAAIMLDSYVPFGWVSNLVPFTSSWHPVAVAWGIIGLYLMLAVELTSLVRNRLPKRVWRGIHFASFGLFVTSAVHALTAGTDSGTLALEAWILGCVALVVGLTVLRVLQASQPPAPKPQRVPVRTAARVAEKEPVLTR